MADVSKIKGTDNQVYNVKDATARSEDFNVIEVVGTNEYLTTAQLNSINKKTLIVHKVSSNSTSFDVLHFHNISTGIIEFSGSSSETGAVVSTRIQLDRSTRHWAYTTTTCQNSVTGAATTITNDNLTANRALVSNSNGKVAVSDATSDDLATLNKLIFKAAKAYSVGDVVLYSGQFFVCATAKTSSQTGSTYYPSTSGDTTYWTRVFIS